VSIHATTTIESGDGDEITVLSNDRYGVGGIIEKTGESISIWLTAEQANELIRAIGAARVEISKARPQS
jgi:hypothetical protein